MHECGQLYCCGTDRIHRARHQLRYVRSPPRHSPDQQAELLQAAQDSAEADAAEDGASGGGKERTVYDCMGEGIKWLYTDGRSDIILYITNRGGE